MCTLCGYKSHEFLENAYQQADGFDKLSSKKHAAAAITLCKYTAAPVTGHDFMQM